MGLNFRKSISLAKGLKLNVGKKSASLSAGIPGARYSVSTNGTRRATFGIPGTGLSYTKTFGTKADEKKANDRAKGKEAKKNEELVENYEEQVEEVIGIHRDGIDIINWKSASDVPSGLTKLRDRVLAGDIDAYYEVIEECEPFDALVDFGSEFEIGTDNPESMSVEFNIKAEDVLPKTKLELGASGKLVEKELSKTAYYDIYQDYVCSVSIRLARDIFALLPVEKVLVNAVNVEVNTATGNEEEVCYLSVIFDRATFEKINLDRIDPSDSFDNFEYNMKFAKSSGFKPVNKMNF